MTCINETKWGSPMTEISNRKFTGERACFGTAGAHFTDCVFEDGESPLKESRDLVLTGCAFRWKYPLWYCKNVVCDGTHWFEIARAGVWYTENVTVKNAVIQGPKNFRRCRGVTLENVDITNAQETLWTCKDVSLKNVSAVGAYFGMNSENVTVENLRLDGNYCFDGAKNVTVKNSVFLSKDAFWNTENVTVENSYLCGEYLGWNAKNLTFVNCTIESLQGLCYIEALRLVNCKLLNTTLAFEYSDVDADIITGVDSVINPRSGRISAEYIGELILEKDKIDPSKTVFTLRYTK